MGKQRFSRTDLPTGATRITGWDVGDDGPLGERARTLEANVMALLEGAPPCEGPALRIVCDGCGAQVILNRHDPQRPPGWTGSERGDFCRRCT